MAIIINIVIKTKCILNVTHKFCSLLIAFLYRTYAKINPGLRFISWSCCNFIPLQNIILQIFTAFYTLRSQTLVIATNSEPRWQKVIIKLSTLDEPLLLSGYFGYLAFILLSILSAPVEKLLCPNITCHLLLILTSLTLPSSDFFRNFLVVDNLFQIT